MTSVASDNGYHLIRGRSDGLEFWIVSDLNVAELDDFARRLQREAANGGAVQQRE